MGDEEQVTLDGQFLEYSKFMDNKRSGITITLYRSDFWMRQAKIIDDRKITMTDTGKIYCNAVWDGFLCWPPTEANTVVYQNCPAIHLIDTSNNAFRKCDGVGNWTGRYVNDTRGWTNYTPCFPERVRILMEKVYDENGTVAEAKFEIAQRTRHLEIVGFSLSFLALLISMIIYCCFRSLRNSRTKIHKNLFTAMILQVFIRLTVYIDQAVNRRIGDNFIHNNFTKKGIDDMPYVCEMSYILLEYTISVMFMWMFIEGLHLHNVVTANSLRQRLSHVMFYMIGWGVPVLLTVTWAVATAFLYSNDNWRTCWYGYNFTWRYWILQGPRFVIIMVNLIFLLKILRVLIVKLQDSRTSELEKLRKAVRAALVLLPLLGITNLLNMLEAPLNGAVWKFALWCYITHFLRSFQGFFIALIYCFMNGEVRSVIYKRYQTYKSLRMDRFRQSRAFSLPEESGSVQSREAVSSGFQLPEPEREEQCCILSCFSWLVRRPTPPPPPMTWLSFEYSMQPIYDPVLEINRITQLRAELKQLCSEIASAPNLTNNPQIERDRLSARRYLKYIQGSEELEFRLRHIRATGINRRIQILNDMNSGRSIPLSITEEIDLNSVASRDAEGNFELVTLPEINSRGCGSSTESAGGRRGRY